jgi:hypothetical protein
MRHELTLNPTKLVIAGTQRILSHDVFPELHWHRDPFQHHLYEIPDGFASREDILGAEFLDIIADICALQRMRESGADYPANSLEVEKVDNQQAWIESRLQFLQTQTSEPLLLCCIPAAYLCGYSFFADVWAASLIPYSLSKHLLQALQDHESWADWDSHSDILLWLLNVGAAFAPDAEVRLGFAGLWYGSHRTRLRPLSGSWEEIEGYLRKFIYSEAIHWPRCAAFYERLLSM